MRRSRTHALSHASSFWRPLLTLQQWFLRSQPCQDDDSKHASPLLSSAFFSSFPGMCPFLKSTKAHWDMNLSVHDDCAKNLISVEENATYVSPPGDIGHTNLLLQKQARFLTHLTPILSCPRWRLPRMTDSWSAHFPSETLSPIPSTTFRRVVWLGPPVDSITYTDTSSLLKNELFNLISPHVGWLQPHPHLATTVLFTVSSLMASENLNVNYVFIMTKEKAKLAL